MAGPRELDLAGHGGRRKKEEKARDGGALGVLIGQGAPERGKWCLGAVDLALGDSTASGRRRQRRCAGRGCRGGSGKGLGRVCARGGAKGRARWR